MDTHLINKGMNALALIDHDIADAFEEFGPPPPRYGTKGFETFLSTIVSQQISTEVAQVIMGRVTNLLSDITAKSFLLIADEELRGAGLSYRKIDYAKNLAEAVYKGLFDIDSLESMTDEDAINAITALRGFGCWSAEIYLMFSLNRQDIFPADDLALRVALGRLKNVSNKLTSKQARNLVAHWAPWRSVGSLFLWHYYRGAPK